MSESVFRAVDLSRPRLKSLAKWIRDNLDTIVAREGPNVLKPDDVLTLHETFVALRHATGITALDLRATGIHRAVQDVAGVATRWPGRLCDDCDIIIALWTAKFGPFSQLHPFLYGRGGRLEGIASVAEHSREALLKRWSLTCPEKLHPKRSHRLGHLGFRAGDWWINTLYAHHAGIIGLEAVEGGTTFDKHGAYAVVLKTTGEVEAREGDHFTYRVPHSDKGKFRLTAATPRSRDPIRVLRSHSISSIWGPKAGVRYEGLYGVTGWSIRHAKAKDSAMGESNLGEVIFEVRFKRIEVVSIDEVNKRPTATEIDDFLEYKRLQRFQRDNKRRVTEVTAQFLPIEFQHAAQDEPLVAPPRSSKSNEPNVMPPLESSGLSRRSMFKRLRYDMPERDPHSESDVVSPGTIPDTDQFPLVLSKNNIPLLPAHAERQQHFHVGAESISTGSKKLLEPGMKSITSSAYAASKTGPDIREVAPWIDFEYTLTVPPSTDNAPNTHDEVTSQTSKVSGRDSKHSQPSTNTERDVYHDAQDSPTFPTVRNRRKSGNFKGLTRLLSPGSLVAKRTDTRKSTPKRSSNPMAKLFDGAVSVDEDDDDYSTGATYGLRATSHEKLRKSPSQNRRRQRASSSDSALRVHSPKPIRLFSPKTPYGMARRGAIYTDEDEVPQVSFPVMPGQKITSTRPFVLPQDDPFLETPSSIIPASLPLSLKNFISESKMGIPMMDSDTSSNFPTCRKDAEDCDTAEQLREVMNGKDIKVAFKNPFRASPSSSPKKRREHSVSVAPDVVA